MAARRSVLSLRLVVRRFHNERRAGEVKIFETASDSSSSAPHSALSSVFIPRDDPLNGGLVSFTLHSSGDPRNSVSKDLRTYSVVGQRSLSGACGDKIDSEINQGRPDHDELGVEEYLVRKSYDRQRPYSHLSGNRLDSHAGLMGSMRAGGSSGGGHGSSPNFLGWKNRRVERTVGQSWREDPYEIDELSEPRSAHQDFRSPASHQGYQQSPPEPSPVDLCVPVKAFYVARSLDVKGLVDGPYRSFPQHLSRNHVIIQFSDTDSHNDPFPFHAQQPGSSDEVLVQPHPLPTPPPRFLVAFNYGSVVLFNFGQQQQEECLRVVNAHADGQFTEAHKDDYSVVLRPELPGWSEGGHDHVIVRQLDTNNIRVISSILGQSVALEHYARKVDEMVNTFSELNRGMEQTGTFTMKRKKLFQLVAAANTTLADVILRLGLLERSDTAWKHAQYAKIWEYLRDDFELDERFESLDFKLNIIQHNVRFFLDILQNRKSDTLEWIIILLIAGEISISLYEILHTAMK